MYICSCTYDKVFNRPGVAGAVLQTALFWNVFMTKLKKNIYKVSLYLGLFTYVYMLLQICCCFA